MVLGQALKELISIFGIYDAILAKLIAESGELNDNEHHVCNDWHGAWCVTWSLRCSL